MVFGRVLCPMPFPRVAFQCALLRSYLVTDYAEIPSRNSWLLPNKCAKERHHKLLLFFLSRARTHTQARFQCFHGECTLVQGNNDS